MTAAEAGLHIVIDKPLSTKLTECDRLIDAIERNKVTCLVWNRNYLPSLIQANNKIQSKEIGKLLSLHCDFYFSKDAGPPIGSSKPNDPPINWLDRHSLKLMPMDLMEALVKKRWGKPEVEEDLSFGIHTNAH